MCSAENPAVKHDRAGGNPSNAPGPIKFSAARLGESMNDCDLIIISDAESCACKCVSKRCQKARDVSRFEILSNVELHVRVVIDEAMFG